MRHLTSFAALLALSGFSLPGHAQEIQACPALSLEKTYDGKRQALKFLTPGADGYLFISGKDFIKGGPIPDFQLESLLTLQKRLKDRKIDLVLVRQPTRGLVHADKVSATDQKNYGFDPQQVRQHYDAMTKQLRGAGVTVGTLPDLSMADYAYARDHHWTAMGAKAVAEDTAAQIKKLPVYATLPTAAFDTKKSDAPEKFSGAMANAYKDLCKKSLPPEMIDIYTTVQSGASSDDLFGDKKAAPVALTGTSFSNNESARANFDGWLRQSLSVDVANFAISGGGFGASILSYLASEDYKNGAQSVLIWEIPGYFESFGGRGEWRELTAAVWGDCAGTAREIATAHFTLGPNAVALFDKDQWPAPATGDAGKTTSWVDKIRGVGKAEISPLYAVVTFDAEPGKKIGATVEYGDKARDRFNLDHADRLGQNLPYYIDLSSYQGVGNLLLKPQEKDRGLKGTARLCRAPAL